MNKTMRLETLISPQKPLQVISLKEIWRYKDLIKLFVYRDFVAVYKQTVLGPVWYIIQPLTTTIVFTIIFGKVAKIPTDGLPPSIFYMCATVVWSYFAGCLTKTSNTFIANINVFSKVFFPRITVPISVVISQLISFFLQFAFFLVYLLYFRFTGLKFDMHWQWLVSTPLLLLQMALLSLGTGLIISSLTTKYRDLTFLLAFGIQLWMYITPVMYPLSIVPEKWRLIVALNPMTAIVESFRFAFLGNGVPTISYCFVGAGVTGLLLLTGLVLFSKTEKQFVDTV